MITSKYDYSDVMILRPDQSIDDFLLPQHHGPELVDYFQKYFEFEYFSSVKHWLLQWIKIGGFTCKSSFPQINIPGEVKIGSDSTSGMWFFHKEEGSGNLTIHFLNLIQDIPLKIVHGSQVYEIYTSCELPEHLETIYKCQTSFLSRQTNETGTIFFRHLTTEDSFDSLHETEQIVCARNVKLFLTMREKSKKQMFKDVIYLRLFLKNPVKYVIGNKDLQTRRCDPDLLKEWILLDVPKGWVLLDM